VQHFNELDRRAMLTSMRSANSKDEWLILSTSGRSPRLDNFIFRINLDNGALKNFAQLDENIIQPLDIGKNWRIM
jgi:hypothetical protein